MSIRYIVMVFAAALTLTACSKENASSDATADVAESAATAKSSSDGPTKVERPAAKDEGRVVGVATTPLKSLGGSSVKGQVLFTESEYTNEDGETERSVLITYEVTGMTPNKTRGFHIHEVGDCSSDDGMSAGGHFNPGGHDHGALHDEHSHAGDFGNITSDSKGNAVGQIANVKKITLDSDADSYIVGRSVIVHAAADDLKSQPTGDAGARVACGVIKMK